MQAFELSMAYQEANIECRGFACDTVTVHTLTSEASCHIEVCLQAYVIFVFVGLCLVAASQLAASATGAGFTTSREVPCLCVMSVSKLDPKEPHNMRPYCKCAGSSLCCGCQQGISTDPGYNTSAMVCRVVSVLSLPVR